MSTARPAHPNPDSDLDALLRRHLAGEPLAETADALGLTLPELVERLDAPEVAALLERLARVVARRADLIAADARASALLKLEALTLDASAAPTELRRASSTLARETRPARPNRPTRSDHPTPSGRRLPDRPVQTGSPSVPQTQPHAANRAPRAPSFPPAPRPDLRSTDLLQHLRAIAAPTPDPAPTASSPPLPSAPSPAASLQRSAGALRPAA